MRGTRRELMGLLGLLPLPVWTGCSQSSNPLPELRYWGTGTLDIGRPNWEAAAAQIGARVTFTDNGNDLGPVLARMLSGTASTDFHLGGVQGGAEPELFKAQAILPWDTSRLKNWSSIPENVRAGIPYLKSGQDTIGVPVVVNADSIIYRENETGRVDSYAAVFDPKFRGRSSMEDSWMNSVIFAAIFMKENNIEGMASIQEPGNLTETELMTVIEFLKKHKRDGQFYKFWSGWEEGVDLVTRGDVVVMTGWEPIVLEAQRRGAADIKYAEPVEGYEGWSNNVVLHSGVRSERNRDLGIEDAAYRFVDWLLGGAYGCMLGSLRGYMVPTTNCTTLLKSKPDFSYVGSAGEAVGVSIEEASALYDHVNRKLTQHKGGVYWQNARPDNYALYERLWAELRTS